MNPLLEQSPYQAYAYSYPHKTAYRPLEPPLLLRDLWAREKRDALFLYIHLPFCEMRCGFCNLFTTANPHQDFTASYLQALQRQAERVRAALGDTQFARLAIGGGTPTFLDTSDLEQVLNMAEELFQADIQAIPASVETSPRTATSEKLRLLRERGVDRISIGVQSFVETETAASGRAQKPEWVEQALERIREAGFPTLNIDLIYGLPGQTLTTWQDSLRRALQYAPEELYLYPLYVRPLTGLDRTHKQWDDSRLECYRAGRGLLLEAGYVQVSMRMFRRKNINQESAPVYCCQEDGMVGLGCGARSYTRLVHYATEYAVGRNGVREILSDYIARPSKAFDAADYGFILDAEDQRRRYVIKSLLQAEGMELEAYRLHFGQSVWTDLPFLQELEAQGLAVRQNGWLRLTEAGLEHSDAVGPAFYSKRARGLMESYTLR